MTRNLLTLLLVLAIGAFFLDLGHMLYHLAGNTSLWKIEGVPAKLAVKIVVFSLPLFLLIFRRVWIRRLLFLALCLALSPPYALAGKSCGHARELLEKAGTARDASENWLEKVKVKPPNGSFPSDMDKITWWGIFKPFEFWENPKFDAVWIRPDGTEAGRQTFRGNKCRLAKTALKASEQPRGEFQSGMWNVIVTCEDTLIDKQSFAVLPAAGSVPSGPDRPPSSGDHVTIWAGEDLKR